MIQIFNFANLEFSNLNFYFQILNIQILNFANLEFSNFKFLFPNLEFPNLESILYMYM